MSCKSSFQVRTDRFELLHESSKLKEPKEFAIVGELTINDQRWNASQKVEYKVTGEVILGY